MKTNKMLIIVTALVFALVLSTADASENTGMRGTWVNAKYSSSSIAPKLIIMEDGTTEAYSQLSATQRYWYGSYAVVDTWTDSEQNVWYKAKFTSIEGPRTLVDYELIRISEYGAVFECVLDYKDYPSELNPANLTYRRYARQ